MARASVRAPRPAGTPQKHGGPSAVRAAPHRRRSPAAREGDRRCPAARSGPPRRSRRRRAPTPAAPSATSHGPAGTRAQRPPRLPRFRPPLTAVRPDRRPARAGGVPGLPAAWGHPGGPQSGPAVPLVAGPHRNGGGVAPARCRVPVAARGPGHHHPGGRLVFHVFAALADFIRELIVEGTREGLDAARARGQRLGRPPAPTPDQVRHARHRLTEPTNTVTSIARLLGVSRSTLYKHIPDESRRPWRAPSTWRWFVSSVNGGHRGRDDPAAGSEGVRPPD